MKIVLLTNILSPYRKVFYDLLYHEFLQIGMELTVLVMAETEANRVWRYDEYSAPYTKLLNGGTINALGMHFHLNTNLRKYLSDISPDVVVCAGGYTLPSVWQAVWLKKKLAYKTIFWSESHLNEMKGHNSFKICVRELVRSYIYKKFDGFWYAGKKSLELIEKYCGGGKTFFFVPNLIDDRFFATASSLEYRQSSSYRVQHRIQPEQFMLACPARLTSVKGILPFIDILAEVPDRDRITVVIAGEGELRDDILAKAKLAGVDIRLLGQQAPEDILQTYGSANAFLMPSLSDPNPLTCIEAAWAGLPLLVSEHVGNYPELVRQGENGYIFSYQKVKEAAAFINRLVNNTPEWFVNARVVSQHIADEIYSSARVVQGIAVEMKRYIEHEE